MSLVKNPKWLNQYLSSTFHELLRISFQCWSKALQTNFLYLERGRKYFELGVKVNEVCNKLRSTQIKHGLSFNA